MLLLGDVIQPTPGPLLRGREAEGAGKKKGERASRSAYTQTEVQEDSGSGEVYTLWCGWRVWCEVGRSTFGEVGRG